MKESYPYQEEFVDFLDIDRGLSERSIEAYCIDLRVFAGFLRGMWQIGCVMLKISISEGF